jgi:diguanylate cyclase (GGDEF)-like protein
MERKAVDDRSAGPGRRGLGRIGGGLLHLVRPRQDSPVAKVAWEWSWERQLRLEEVSSWARASAALGVTGALATGLAPSGPASWAVTAALWAFVGVDRWLRQRRPESISRYPWGSALIDWTLYVGLILTTGAGGSPLTLLLPFGLVWQAHRLPPRFSLPGTALYLISYLFLGPQGSHLATDGWLLASLGCFMAAGAARREQLHRENLRDALTGAFSRAYGLFALRRMARARELPFSVIFLDLDGFKQVNDTLGHDAGDALLVETVRVITSSVRAGDVVVRHGGDEFLVILPGADTATACSVAQRIRERVRSTSVLLRGHLPAATQVTASCGVAEADPGQHAEDLLRLADRRLYKAKTLRDCVVALNGDGA